MNPKFDTKIFLTKMDFLISISNMVSANLQNLPYTGNLLERFEPKPDRMSYPMEYPGFELTATLEPNLGGPEKGRV